MATTSTTRADALQRAANLARLLTWGESRILRRILASIGSQQKADIVTAQAAGEARAARSGAHTALRLLAAADVIRTWPRGAKGTRVEVVDPETLAALRDLLAKER